HVGGIRALRFSPDGKRLLSRGLDYTLLEWDLATFQERRQLFSKASRPVKAGWSWNIMDHSPDGSMIAVTGYFSTSAQDEPTPDPRIHIWATATGKDVHTLVGHKERVTSASFSPDGKLLASWASDGIRLWNLTDGKEVYRIATRASP